MQFTVISGNLGRDPELRYVPSGAAVTNFSVAVNERRKNADGETINDTIWFRCTAWNKLAEICNQYLRRGSKVLITGKLQHEDGSPRVWTGQDGNPSASFELRVDNIEFLSPKGTNGEVVTEVTEEEIPF